MLHQVHNQFVLLVIDETESLILNIKLLFYLLCFAPIFLACFEALVQLFRFLWVGIVLVEIFRESSHFTCGEFARARYFYR